MNILTHTHTDLDYFLPVDDLQFLQVVSEQLRPSPPLQQPQQAHCRGTTLTVAAVYTSVLLRIDILPPTWGHLSAENSGKHLFCVIILI